MGVVERSRSDRFKQGDVVNTGLGGWTSHVIANAMMLSPAPQLPGVPMTAYMSVLGATGLTAWFGMCDIGKPQPGETVVVSAAAGAVGSIAGQIAKLKGARVIGIAGGKAKCDWLTDELGFDGAIDYKNEDVGAALDRLCPNGIDVNFENVGGDYHGRGGVAHEQLRPHASVRHDLDLQRQPAAHPARPTSPRC